MKVQSFVCGYLEENAYLVINESNEALLIDPGSEEGKIEKFIEKNGITLKGILITHYHFDHVGALEYFKEKYNLKVYDIKNVGINRVGEFMFDVFETKGHTDDSCAFYFEEINSLFTGDFLFKESIGRYDFENSSFQDMMKSIAWVKTLNESVRIYPGHGEDTNLKYELKHNEFLK